MKKFKKVYIEITNVCNLKCSFCPVSGRLPGFMDIKGFTHIIREVKPFCDYVYLHLMGEPLLNPNLESFLKICYDSLIKVNITTNGTLLNRCDELLLNSKALRKVSISLHSFEANEGNELLDSYINNTVSFIKKAVEKGIICELRLWNMDNGPIKGTNDMNDEIIRKLEESFQPDFDLWLAVKNKPNVKLEDRLFISGSEIFEWPDISRDIIDEKVFCYGLRDQFGILVDGTVVPCCLDSEGNIPLGNIFKEPLSDILNSERALRIYDGFSGRKAVEELCKKCGYAMRYK
ncbi:radical SAM/SPASM domain-containing protein [Ruminiclostridium papyrosolvens]|uniref:Fe-S oxidoreductase n=1 Tax=Ruminiclostridium papyrosolvens C7 TaxID=1330534 RepID=U4R6E2_9FIRM|nr:radical SAM/SPASM domain-containing protein [Ruminiclostridium papyrosolvens]EPR14337.1 Fe-S oxidoreductase [Ruminiclostridium papyrosolvens C7]